MKEIEPRKSVNAPALFQNLAHASNLGDGDGEETGDNDGDDDGHCGHGGLPVPVWSQSSWGRRSLRLVGREESSWDLTAENFCAEKIW